MSIKRITPTDSLKRSPLYREQMALGGEFIELNGWSIAAKYAAIATEHSALKGAALSDVTPLLRTGFKGAFANDWLSKQGVRIPKRPNTTQLQTDGTVVLRLSDSETLLQQAPSSDGQLIKTLLAKHAESARPPSKGSDVCYELPRAHSHACLTLSGQHAVAVMSKLCAVDCSKASLGPNGVAQTSVARVSHIVARVDEGLANDRLYLFCESASLIFSWRCLLDAMEEFGGAAVGLLAFAD